ncbi:MAG: TRAP transporter substrate-binding protein DctP [Synergistales bacterium]|nr:TRAP transporter substrate-binding protein DctP [Synergistales bacterium]
MSGAALAADVTLKFSGQQPADHPATAMMKQIAKDIEEKSDGRMEVKVYPANQLGDYELVYEEMIKGTIAMSCQSVPSQFDPRMELVYINGYLRSYEQAEEIFATDGWLRKKMNEFNERLGVKLLGFYLEGMIGTGLNKAANEPLNPDVDKGAMIRVPNMAVYKLAAQAMGYRTVSIPWSDVYQSMQTGVVDGENGFSISAAYTWLGDVLTHYYATNYSAEVLNFMISAKTWEKLSDENKAVIAEVIDKAAAKSIENAKARDEEFLDKMREKGIEVHTYTEEELKPIAEACASTWTELEDRMGKELMDEFRKHMAPK